MKRNIFYIDNNILIEYLNKYGKGAKSKDYEFAIGLHAKKYFEENLKQQLTIVFEQNTKQHKYPNRFTPNLEQLKEILTTFNEENTPVDFALAPVSSNKLEGYAYPFQIKRFYSNPSKKTDEALAAFINEKANSYRSSQVSLIIVPQLVDQDVDTKGFNTIDVVNKLEINDDAVRAIYIFQFFNNKPKFVLLWASPGAIVKNV